MCAPGKLHPSVLKAFRDRKFVGQKTKIPFSWIVLDQMHEQLIGSLKCDGGIIVYQQKIQRHSIESSINCTTDLKHHEQYPKFQSKFKMLNHWSMLSLI